MLHAGRGLPEWVLRRYKVGAYNPEPGRHMLMIQLRAGPVPAGLFLHPATRATDSPTGMARWSLSGLGFCIVLGGE